MQIQKPILFVALIFAAACSPKITTTVFKLPENPPKNDAPPPRPTHQSGCMKWENHLPDPDNPEFMPVKYLRVNFHILDSRDGSHNFKPGEAQTYFLELLKLANEELAVNEPNWRSPAGTPALPKRYQYKLAPQPGDDGFYFHRDDSLYYYVSMGRYQNNYSMEVMEKYTVGKDSIFNVFILVHPDDSIRSPTYRANGQGIALGTSLKMAGIFESKLPAESFDGLMNHEIGHNLTLAHAWTEDGCPDTDNHPNKCFVCEEKPPCDNRCTNNMMDYNHYQIALTPCQIGKIHATFSNEKSRIRKCLEPNWCKNSGEEIVVRGKTEWSGGRDLEANLTIAPGAELKIGCRLSLPPGGKITVQPGGKLLLDGCRLHQACGQKWKGVFVESSKTETGSVEILKTPVFENLD